MISDCEPYVVGAHASTSGGLSNVEVELIVLVVVGQPYDTQWGWLGTATDMWLIQLQPPIVVNL
jgi:hypothetical protein